MSHNKRFSIAQAKEASYYDLWTSYYDFERLGRNFVTGNIVVRSPSIVLQYGGASDTNLQLMGLLYYDLSRSEYDFCEPEFSI